MAALGGFGGASAGQGGAAAVSPPVPGSRDSFVNLHPYIDVDRSAVLNADSSTTLKSILGVNPGILRSDSDTDPEMILVVQFREAVKLRGLKLLANEVKSDADIEASAPATIKLFLHRPNYSFSDCESEEATETVTLTPAQVQSGEEVKLKFVKWQNVTNLTMFISSNQEDSPVTFLNQLDFVGQVVAGFNMKQLKDLSKEE